MARGSSKVEPALVAPGYWLARFGAGPELPPQVRRAYAISDQVEDAQRRVEARRRAAERVERADQRLARCAVEASAWSAMTGRPFDPLHWEQSWPSIQERSEYDDRIDYDRAVRDERRRAVAAGLTHLLPGAVE